MILLQLEKIIKLKGGVQKLAKALNVNRQTVYYYINQGDKNSIDTLKKIAEALEIGLFDLFEKDNGELTAVIEYKGNLIKLGSIKELEEFIETTKTQSIRGAEISENIHS